MANVYTLRGLKKTITGSNTAERLQAVVTTSDRFGQGLILLCPSGNAGTVYFGDSTVDSTSGFPVAAGGSLNLSEIFKGERVRPWDLSAIYVYGTANDTIRILKENEVPTS